MDLRNLKASPFSTNSQHFQVGIFIFGIQESGCWGRRGMPSLRLTAPGFCGETSSYGRTIGFLRKLAALGSRLHTGRSTKANSRAFCL